MAAGAAGLAFYSGPCLADGLDGPAFTMDAPKYDQPLGLLEAELRRPRSSFYGRLQLAAAWEEHELCSEDGDV